MTNEEYWKTVFVRLGHVVFDYVDRMNDLVPEDDAEKVLSEFLVPVNAILKEMTAPNPFYDVPAKSCAESQIETSAELT